MIGLVVPDIDWESVLTWFDRLRTTRISTAWWVDDATAPTVMIPALTRHVAPPIRFGMMISGLQDVPPLYAWKQIVTIDRLSEGRLDIGINDLAVWDAIGRARDDSRFLPTSLQQPHPRAWVVSPATSAECGKAAHDVTGDNSSVVGETKSLPRVELMSSPTAERIQTFEASGMGCILRVSLQEAEKLLAFCD